MQPTVFFVVLALCGVAAHAQQQNQLDGNRALFSVMAALDAAAGDAGARPAAGHPVREQVRRAIASRQLPVVEDLRRYVAAQKKAGSGPDLGQYVSFALATTGPPEFKPAFLSNEMPPDAAALDTFAPLMARFHKEAGIDELWQKAQPALEEAIARYHEPVTRAVLETTAYLRNPTSGYMGRRFQVYLELLAPPNQIHTRSYKDDYYIVVTPSPEPRTADVRHAYLHFLLDPLATKFSAQINEKRSLLDIAEGAPLLDATYKSDFLLLATESLIRAIESRLDRKPDLVHLALREGFVLAPFFAEQLPLYEKQDAAMRLHFPDMVSAINLNAESKRLANVEFARVRETPVVKAPEPALSPVEASLEAADKLYAERALDKARAAYLDILKQAAAPALHARAYYGLARIAALEKQPDMAQELFRKTLDLDPDPQTRSWTQVYLGRLAELSQEPEEAARHYRAALDTKGITDAAKKAAQQGLDKISQSK